MWSVADVADALEAGFTREDARLREEQAVYGLDALDELDLHPVIARAFEGAAYGVFREQRYPADRRMTRESEGERCDFVLTPDGRPLAVPAQEPTLFDPPDAVGLDQAFWLEVKVVAQFTTNGPNRNYSSQLLGAVQSDVGKLSREMGIIHCGVLVVLFTQDQRIAEHDLAAWLARCLDRRLPIGSPSTREFTITDRLGNGVCVIALYPVHHR
ncbi:MAG: hypothetical protein O7D97_00645 [Planctomycetota bacterium]|nr:hypothetical protein [Planctomycetota bacterium]